MVNELSVTFKDTYVEIISNGEKSYQSSLRLWANALKVCRENNCYKVLGIANSTKAPSTIDSYKHAELLHNFNVDFKYKIAWVELNPKEFEGIKFLENVLFNRGLNVKLFKDIDAAKTWLLNEEISQNA